MNHLKKFGLNTSHWKEKQVQAQLKQCKMSFFLFSLCVRQFLDDSELHAIMLKEKLKE